MSSIRKHSPTNKEFKRNFQNLASTQTKKGHLNNQDKKPTDNGIETGILIRVDRTKYEENGWEVQVGTGNDAVTYMCVNLDYAIPEFTETDNYLVFKGKVEVELSIDKKNKIYQITRIKSAIKKPLAAYNDKIRISTNNDENTQTGTESNIEVTKDSVVINSNNVIISDNNNNEINLIESQQVIGSLQQEIQDLKETQDSLLSKIKIIEEGTSEIEEEATETEEGEGE